MRVPTASLVVLSAALGCLIAAGCRPHDRQRELAECAAIQSTTYVEGTVRDCLVERYGWDRDAAEQAEREKRNELLPDGSRKPQDEFAAEGTQPGRGD